jgi:hypothetical protein
VSRPSLLAFEYEDAPIAVDLTESERALLVRGLNPWGGPARCSESLARAMGFEGLQSFAQEVRSILEALKTHKPLPPLDWLRALAATEIPFASYVLGCAADWRIGTGLSDEATLPVLRGLQVKLMRRLAELRHGPLPDPPTRA